MLSIQGHQWLFEWDKMMVSHVVPEREAWLCYFAIFLNYTINQSVILQIQAEFFCGWYLSSHLRSNVFILCDVNS